MLPFKAAILDYASKHVDEVLTVESIMEGMKDTPYAGETNFRENIVDEYCIAFNSCGFFDQIDSELTENGDIRISYKISETGIASAKKYIK